jgi:hypothetical protein
MQQRRLADPGLPPDDQRRALAPPDAIKKAIDLSALAGAPAKGRCSHFGHKPP